jgi:hypothetical protein
MIIYLIPGAGFSGNPANCSFNTVLFLTPVFQKHPGLRDWIIYFLGRAAWQLAGAGPILGPE